MSIPAGKLASYEDLLSLPDNVRAEILDGHIVTMPAPLPRHSKPQRAIGRFIGGPFDDDDGRGGPGGWWIFVEVDIQLTQHDIVRPDLAGWRRERLPQPGRQRPINIVPDFVCEICSPSTETIDRVTKRRLYAQHGVPFYWIVDPESRTLEALELQAGRWLEIGAWDESATARIAPFSEVEIEVGRLFLPKDADPPESG
jgi:Uma2 family endonuclease